MGEKVRESETKDMYSGNERPGNRLGGETTATHEQPVQEERA